MKSCPRPQPSSVKNPADSRNASSRLLFYVMLPKSHYRPAVSSKSHRDHLVTHCIPLKFFPPEFGVVLGPTTVLRTVVPKTSVYKNCNASAGEDEVRSHDRVESRRTMAAEASSLGPSNANTSMSSPSGYPRCAQHPRHRQLSGLVSARANTRHKGRASCLAQKVHHVVLPFCVATSRFLFRRARARPIRIGARRDDNRNSAPSEWCPFC